MDKKCSFGEGITVKPNGVDELDPCKYVVEEEYMNVTVRVLKCRKCGHVEIEWERQQNTQEIIELCTFPDSDDDYCKVFAVTRDWLVDILDRLDQCNEQKGADLENFLENYVWDETWFIYEQAKAFGEILREEEQK